MRSRDLQLLEWLASGEGGLSSETMAFAAAGIVKRSFVGGIDYPRDPADLMRCMKLVARLPWVRREAEPLLRAHSLEWAALLDDWGYLAALLEWEGPSGQAPLTDARMRDLLDGALSSAPSPKASTPQKEAR